MRKRIVNKKNALARKAANWLASKSEKVPARSKKIIVLLSAGLMSAYFVLTAMYTRTHTSTAASRISNVQLPAVQDTRAADSIEAKRIVDSLLLKLGEYPQEGY